MRSIAVCAAYPLEIKAFCRRVGIACPTSHKPVVWHEASGVRLAAVVSGLGRERMARRVGELDPAIPIDLWVSIGSAGALNPALALHTCLAGGDVISADGELFASDFSSYSTPFQPHSILYCHPHAVSSVEEKAELFQQTGADAVDMESGAVARHAQGRGEVFAWVKVISDRADERLPAALLECMGRDGFPSTAASLRLVLKRPWLLPVLLRMGVRAGRQGGLLADVLMALLAEHGFRGDRQIRHDGG